VVAATWRGDVDYNGRAAIVTTYLASYSKSMFGALGLGGVGRCQGGGGVRSRLSNAELIFDGEGRVRDSYPVKRSRPLATGMAPWD
jgi:hypothetical protein